MQILSALLAEIFVGAHLLIHNAHTTTMLPHLTRVALNEHTTNVIRQHVRRISGRMARLCLDSAATESFATRRRQPWVVLLSTETPRYFLLFIIIWVFLVILTGRIVVVVAGALALARVWEVGSRAIFGIVDGLRAMVG